jgi:hypothetical protein
MASGAQYSLTALIAAGPRTTPKCTGTLTGNIAIIAPDSERPMKTNTTYGAGAVSGNLIYQVHQHTAVFLEPHLIFIPNLGEQQYEGAVSFANWDTYWFTRNHPSLDADRSRRHLTKLLTYPVTVSSVLHEFSGLTTRNQRVTPEGLRSLAGKIESLFYVV